MDGRCDDQGFKRQVAVVKRCVVFGSILINQSAEKKRQHALETPCMPRPQLSALTRVLSPFLGGLKESLPYQKAFKPPQPPA
jgi:hypothetical protein